MIVKRLHNVEKWEKYGNWYVSNKLLINNNTQLEERATEQSPTSAITSLASPMLSCSTTTTPPQNGYLIHSI